MVKYKTKCPHCSHEFVIKTAKTRYVKILQCVNCGKEATYRTTPENKKIVIMGTR